MVPELVHRDLHQQNILIKFHPEKVANPFEINIIDYGLAMQHQGITGEKILSDFSDRIVPIIQGLWYVEGRPKALSRFFLNNAKRLNDYIKFFDQLVLSPSIPTQKPLDNLFSFFETLTKANQDLSCSLKNKVLEAVKQSSLNNMQPLKKAVAECRSIFEKADIKELSFPVAVFETDPKKQRLFNQMEDYYQALEEKAKWLLSSSYEEGLALCTVVNQLRTKTLDAVYHEDGLGSQRLRECQVYCKELLNQNKLLLDIHRDNNYIWGEIAIVFSSLIVLYPLIFLGNFLFTGRIGFFGETKSALGSRKLDEHFEELQTDFAY